MGVPLVSLRQLVRDRIGVPAHDEFFTPTILDSAINLALTTVESEHRWPWNEVAEALTFDANAQAELPDNWRTTRAVVTEYTELIEWPYYDLITRFHQYSADPTHFAVLDRTMHVRPYPSREIVATHIYYEEPKLLAEDDDEPSLPTQHIGVLVAKAAQLCSVREDDRPSAETHLAEYLQGVQRMRKDIRGTSRPVTPRVRAGSWL